jgi:hypothetical protein
MKDYIFAEPTKEFISDCFKNIQGVPKKKDESIAPLFIGGF